MTAILVANISDDILSSGLSKSDHFQMNDIINHDHKKQTRQYEDVTRIQREKFSESPKQTFVLT